MKNGFLKTTDIFNILILVGYWDKFEEKERELIISILPTKYKSYLTPTTNHPENCVI